MMSFNKKLVLASLTSILVGTAGVISVMAAIPDTNGIVHGCYRNNGGALRVIDSPSQTCNANETATAWSSQTKGNLLINDLDNADLTEARLQYLYLPGVSFQNSELGAAYLTGSNLTNANFSGASMDGLSLKRVNADGANFSNSPRIGINSEQASIKNSNFSGATIASIIGGDFSGADFTDVNLVGSIGEANLSNVDFRGISINEIRADIYGSNLTNANFSGISVPNTVDSFSLSGSNLTNANFTNANFSALNGTSMSGANTTNTNFSGATFNNVIFDQTDLSTANLTGTTWVNVFCPDRTYSQNNGNTCIGHTNVVYQ